MTTIANRIASAEREASSRLCSSCQHAKENPISSKVLYDRLQQVLADRQRRATVEELLKDAASHEEKAAALRSLAADRERHGNAPGRLPQ